MYWQGAGAAFTQQTARVAADYWQTQELPVVAASNTGDTIEVLCQAGIPAAAIVCVTHMVGFREPGHDEMAAETRDALKAQETKVLTTTHALAGVDRALRFQFQGIYPPEIIAHSLRMLGQGVKVCVEIGIMALDAGLIPHGQKIIAIGGSGRGADTAVVLTPAHSNAVFETMIHEILCKPADW